LYLNSKCDIISKRETPRATEGLPELGECSPANVFACIPMLSRARRLVKRVACFFFPRLISALKSISLTVWPMIIDLLAASDIPSEQDFCNPEKT
jgi:hypothetical protein